jgi:O-antigen/teichoic acid export membrane protein
LTASTPLKNDYNKQEMDVYSGVRWSALSKYGAEAVHFAVSITLARLLAPEHFGLLGMAMVVTGFVRIFRQFGFKAAIVRRKQISDELLSTLFWVNLAICVIVAGIVVAIAPLAALLYGEPRVTAIVAVLSLNFVLAGLKTVPMALLERRMAFDKLAVREVGAIIVNGGTSITLAVLGYEVWALVWGTLAGAAAQVVLINAIHPFKPRLVFDRAGLNECLSFGLNLTGANFFNYFTHSSDKLIIGMFLGPMALGFYTLARRLVLMPVDAITNVMSRVLFPAFAKMQDNDDRLARAYLRVCEIIGFVTFPIFAGMVVLAEPFVHVVLGDKWLPAVPLLWIFAPTGALIAFWKPTSHLYTAKGHASWYMRLCAIRGVTFVIAYLFSVNWGTPGLAVAFAMSYVIFFTISFRLACRAVPSLTARRLLAALRPYVAATAAMSVTVFLALLTLRQLDDRPVIHLAGGVVCGVVVYGAIALAFRLSASRDLLRIVPLARRSRLAAWIVG